jgi:predicted PurR-regulated permease PerM
MQNPFKSRSLKLLLPYLLLAIAIIAAYNIIGQFGFFVGAIGQLWGIITPFFYGFLLAYIINIPCGGMQRALGKIKWRFINKRKKSLGLIITFVIIASLFFLVLYLIVPAVFRSILLFIASFPAHYERALQAVDYFNELDLLGIYINVDEIMLLLQDRVQNFSVEDITSSLSALMVVPSALFTGFLAFISSVYILIEKDKFKSIICRALRAFFPVGVCNAIILIKILSNISRCRR